MTMDFRTIANAFNIAFRMRNMAETEFHTYGMRHVEQTDVGLAVHRSASGKSASFAISMVGSNLNPGETDTRRIFTVTVREENANHG